MIVNTGSRFIAKYKRHRISIVELTEKKSRAYDITVEAPDGCYAVNTWEYFDNMEEAVRYAVKGALLDI